MLHQLSHQHSAFISKAEFKEGKRATANSPLLIDIPPIQDKYVDADEL